MKQQQTTAVRASGVLPVIVKTLTQDKIDRYAAVSGDGNPLHTNVAFAAKTRFGGTVAHGMLVLAYLSEMLTAAFGEDWLRSGRLKVRFRAPARPGDTVTASGSVIHNQSGRTRCAVQCANQQGEVLISGEAEVEA